jgi:zinc transporter
MKPMIDPSYGSDQHGLVWGYRFAPNQSGQPISLDEAKTLRLSPNSANPNEFIWLHFSLSNASCESWMRQNLPLPEAFYDSLRGGFGGARLEQDAETLVAVIQDVLFDFKFDPSAVATASLCVEPRLLVSARLRPLRSVDQLRIAVRQGHTFRSTAEILAHLLQDQSEVLVNILRQATQRVDKIEDQLLANRISVSRRELGAMRRVLVRLQRLLAPEPAALFRLLNRPPAWITEEDLQDMRQAAEEFSAAIGDTGALIERVKLLQEEMSALVTEQTNRTLFILTLVTVLALPINLTAGLLGMNVGGIPLADNSFGFFEIAGGLLVLTILLAYVVLIRRRD